MVWRREPRALERLAVIKELRDPNNQYKVYNGKASETHSRKKQQAYFKWFDSYKILIIEMVHNVWCDDSVVIRSIR